MGSRQHFFFFFFAKTSACSVPAGSHGPQGWSASYPECAATNQSPVDISDEEALVSEEYQELMLEKFSVESSNQTTMKNTGKTGLPLRGGFISLFIPFVSFLRRLNSASHPHTHKQIGRIWNPGCNLFSTGADDS